MADDDVSGVLVASRALVGVAARSLAAVEDDVTLTQYRALVLLGSRGELNVRALAEALAIHPSTTTRLCDRLVAKDLVSRAPSAASRREITVRITPEGAHLLRLVTARRRREIRAILDRLPAAQRRNARAAFEAFGAAAGEMPDDAWKLGWT